MKRSRPLQRKTWPARSKPMKRVNSKRKAARRAEQFGSQAELCERAWCVVCHAGALRFAKQLWPGRTNLVVIEDVQTGCVAHHEPPRGTQGKSFDEDTVPLCSLHHTQRHSMPAEDFWRRHQVNWRAVRDEMRRRTAEANQ